MKNTNIVLMAVIGSLSLLSCELYGQEQKEMTGHETDSLEQASQREIHAQEIRDKNTIADYEYDRKQTRATAKRAQRVENEANTAARESRYALRAEKRAQKARRDADKQAEKASRARIKSDKN